MPASFQPSMLQLGLTEGQSWRRWVLWWFGCGVCERTHMCAHAWCGPNSTASTGTLMRFSVTHIAFQHSGRRPIDVIFCKCSIPVYHRWPADTISNWSAFKYQLKMLRKTGALKGKSKSVIHEERMFWLFRDLLTLKWNENCNLLIKSSQINSLDEL